MVRQLLELFEISNIVPDFLNSRDSYLILYLKFEYKSNFELKLFTTSREIINSARKHIKTDTLRIISLSLRAVGLESVLFTLIFGTSETIHLTR